MRRLMSLMAAALFLCTNALVAAETKPIKAIMFCGGGFHDYKTMPGILAKDIAGMANISIDIKHVPTPPDMVAVLKDPKFADGYDVVIYDICYGENWKDGDYDGALDVARAGKPAVFIHCSAHTYRPPRKQDDPQLKEREAIADAKWHALVGMDTRVHDRFGPFSTEKVDKENPIVKSFPDEWKTKGDELYNTIKMMPTATPLLTAKSPSSGKVHTVAWINQYGKARIFGTTLGHDMTTGGDADYHRLLAYGILWTCQKLGEDGKPVEGYGVAPSGQK